MAKHRNVSFENVTLLFGHGMDSAALPVVFPLPWIQDVRDPVAR